MNEFFCIFQYWLPIVKDGVLTCAAILAGYVGLQGLGTWRRQLKGNTEYELAKLLLKTVYELREAIVSVRYPFMSYSQEPEMPEEKLKDLSEQEKKWHTMAQAYQKRWEPVPKAKTNLDATLLEVEVVWGRRIVEKVLPLNGLLGELLGAIGDHLDAQNPNVHYERPGSEELKKRREIMYARGDSDKDEYMKRLLTVIGDIEDELRPHISQYHR